MKRISFLLAVSAMTLLSTPSLWAGVDYTQYNQQFRAEEKAAPAAKPEDRSMQHRSKYFREQQTPAGAEQLPTTKTETPGTQQKYERPDWAK